MASSSTSADKPITVLVADDHPLMREGIATVINAEQDMVVVAEAADGIEAVRLQEQVTPDVVLMDVQMPEMDGIAACIAIRARKADARIIMLSTFRGDVQVLRSVQAGAIGYLLKSKIRFDLPTAIRTVYQGRKYIPVEVAMELAAHVTDETLSAREVDVLRRVAEGHSNRRVAAQLHVTEQTVKSHMKNLMTKLSARDRTHAVMIAIRRGIIEP